MFINIKNAGPSDLSESEEKSCALSKEFLEKEFKDSIKKINKNIFLKLHDLINI